MGRARNPTAYVTKARKMPVNGLFVGKKSLLKTSAAAVVVELDSRPDHTSCNETNQTRSRAHGWARNVVFRSHRLDRSGCCCLNHDVAIVEWCSFDPTKTNPFEQHAVLGDGALLSIHCKHQLQI